VGSFYLSNHESLETGGLDLNPHRRRDDIKDIIEEVV
jgi:hypothetical protein